MNTSLRKVSHNSGVSREQKGDRITFPPHCSRSPEVTSGQGVLRCGSFQSLLCTSAGVRTDCKWILMGFSKERLSMQRMHTLARTPPRHFSSGKSPEASRVQRQTIAGK